MDKINKGFTLPEIIISMTIFMSILLSAFSLIGLVSEHVEKTKILLDVNNFILTIKEFKDVSSKTIAFYSYEQIVDNKITSSDFENQFRADLKDVIENAMKKQVTTTYSLNKPEPCFELVNDLMEQEKDKYVEYGLDQCKNQYNSSYLKDNYNILVIVDKNNLDVSILLIYKFNLYKIVSKLNKNLNQNQIIFKDPNVSPFINVIKLNNNLIFTKFKGDSINNCGTENCIFGNNFAKKYGNNGSIDMGIIKFNQGTDDRINFNTSYKINFLKNLNIKYE